MNVKDMKVFQPIEINGMKLKNRITFGPMGHHPSDKGFVSDWTIGWYELIAGSGVGLVMAGICCPSPMVVQKRKGGSLHFHDDTVIEGWARLADMTHTMGPNWGFSWACSARSDPSAFPRCPLSTKSMPGIF